MTNLLNKDSIIWQMKLLIDKSRWVGLREVAIKPENPNLSLLLHTKESLAFGPLKSVEVIITKIQVPYLLKIVNLKRDCSIETVAVEADIVEICQITNLRWESVIQHIAA